MQPETPPDIIAIPPALLAEVKAAAAREQRPVADVLRDLVAQGLIERREWQLRAEKERQRAIDLGILDPSGGEPVTDDYRQSVREKIAHGLKSLREGQGTDSATFFAEIYAELDALEQQGHE